MQIRHALTSKGVLFPVNPSLFAPAVLAVVRPVMGKTSSPFHFLLHLRLPASSAFAHTVPSTDTSQRLPAALSPFISPHRLRLIPSPSGAACLTAGVAQAVDSKTSSGKTSSVSFPHPNPSLPSPLSHSHVPTHMNKLRGGRRS